VVWSRGQLGSLIAIGVLAALLAVASTADAFVYWGNNSGGTIGRAELEGGGVEQSFIPLPAGSQPCGVVVDGDHIFWADGVSKIGRAKIDGTDVDPSFITGADFPCGPSINAASKTIYWANTANQTIGKANLDGTHVQQGFITQPVENPSWTFDFGNLVYFTNKSAGEIWAASDVDGSGTQEVAGAPLNQPYAFQPTGILIIPDTGFYGPAGYWANFGNGSIGSAPLVGGFLPLADPNFITGLDRPCGLAATATHLFWGNGSSIGKAFLDGTSPDPGFIPGADGACGVAVDRDRALASLTPTSHDFGGDLVSGPPVTQTFTLSNSPDTSVTLDPDVPGLLGPNADQFSITGGTCTPGLTLAPGDSCTIEVSFDPTSLGGKSASLVVDSNDPDKAVKADLFGTGTDPNETVSPASLPFGSRLVGTQSPAQTVTLTNGPGASAPDSIGQATLTGIDSGQFDIVTDGCSNTSLAIGASCQISVRFAPTGNGDALTSLSIPSDDPTSPATVALSGTGTAPDERVIPGSLDFGGQAVGSMSSTQSIEVANTADGTGPLLVGQVSLAGTGYDLVSDGCSGQSVSPGDECQIGVRFAPSAPGSQTASVSIPSNGQPETATVPLAGTGVAAPSQPPAAGAGSACQTLRSKLKKAKSKQKRKSIRKKLKRRGCSD
jgi:hypothetical protein